MPQASTAATANCPPYVHHGVAAARATSAAAAAAGESPFGLAARPTLRSASSGASVAHRASKPYGLRLARVVHQAWRRGGEPQHRQRDRRRRAEPGGEPGQRGHQRQAGEQRRQAVADLGRQG
ncbi:MAG: hypothetical protein U0802_10840 [Candidatus Binatia bacterium]